MCPRAHACVYAVCTVPLLRPLEWKATGKRDTNGFCFLLCKSPLSVCSARNFYHLPTQQLSLSLQSLSTRMKILPYDARENSHKEECRKRTWDRTSFKSGIRYSDRRTLELLDDFRPVPYCWRCIKTLHSFSFLLFLFFFFNSFSLFEFFAYFLINK